MFRTNRIVRYINQNRRSIVLVIGIIVGVIVVVQLLNSFAKQQREAGAKTSNTNTTTSSQNIYQPNKAVITNTQVGETQAKENTEIIENFVEYCNNGEIQKAYDLLTDECKENLYPTVDRFQKNYYNNVFSTKKTHNIQSWMTGRNCYTYKVRFLENILATGEYNSQAIEDYITIIEKDNELKLNINNYVMRQEIKKEQKSNDITIHVAYKDIYKEYEIYAVKVTNNRDNEILLDSLSTVKGIKLIGDTNNVEYQALTNELSDYDVTVPSHNTKTVKIKFSKDYNPMRVAKEIQFLDIILDQEAYQENKEDSTNKGVIEVKLK